VSSSSGSVTIRFEKVWVALMRTMGNGHRVLFNTNKAYIKAINRKMGAN
jgi:hypothetical protein